MLKNMSVVGVLEDDADPMVSVMKLEKAPTETYADIGGLEKQIQEIKVFSFFNSCVCPILIAIIGSGGAASYASRAIRGDGN